MRCGLGTPAYREYRRNRLVLNRANVHKCKDKSYLSYPPPPIYPPSVSLLLLLLAVSLMRASTVTTTQSLVCCSGGTSRAVAHCPTARLNVRLPAKVKSHSTARHRAVLPKLPDCPPGRQAARQTCVPPDCQAARQNGVLPDCPPWCGASRLPDCPLECKTARPKLRMPDCPTARHNGVRPDCPRCCGAVRLPVWLPKCPNACQKWPPPFPTRQVPSGWRRRQSKETRPSNQRTISIGLDVAFCPQACVRVCVCGVCAVCGTSEKSALGQTQGT